RKDHTPRSYTLVAYSHNEKSGLYSPPFVVSPLRLSTILSPSPCPPVCLSVCVYTLYSSMRQDGVCHHATKRYDPQGMRRGVWAGQEVISTLILGKLGSKIQVLKGVKSPARSPYLV